MWKKHRCNRQGRWLDSPVDESEEDEREAEIYRECAKIRSTWTAARWQKECGIPPVEITTAHCECRLLERFD